MTVYLKSELEAMAAEIPEPDPPTVRVELIEAVADWADTLHAGLQGTVVDENGAWKLVRFDNGYSMALGPKQKYKVLNR